MKNVISLILSLACVGCLVVAPASASAMNADASSDTYVEPRAAISLLHSYINGEPSAPLMSAVANKSNGKYIQCWFKNTGTATVTVQVYYEDGTPCFSQEDYPVAPGEQFTEYFIMNCDSSRFYFLIQSDYSGDVKGECAIGQYMTAPARLADEI